MTQPSTAASAAVEGVRISRDDRRDLLLDAAAELLSAGDVEAVSMDSVAQRVGVSRPLVYKHFANRRELLAALYARESLALHKELSASVAAAGSLDEMFRALIHGSLEAQRTRGVTFAVLRHATGRSYERVTEKRSRDRNTLRYFVRQAVRQYDLDETQARAAVSILLGAIDSVLSVYRVHPTAEHAALLEDTYVELVVGGMAALAARRPDR